MRLPSMRSVLPIELGCSLLVLAACRETSVPAQELAAPELVASDTHKGSDMEPPAEAVPKAPPRQASSGLDVGMKIEPFEVDPFNDPGASVCRICELSGKYVVIVSGDIEDELFVEMLLDIQSMAKRYRAPGIEVLAVSVRTPGTGQEDGGRLLELKERRRLSLPVFAASPEDESWVNHYQVSKGLTVMFADAQGVVRYSQVAPASFDELNAAIVTSGVEVDIATTNSETGP